MKEPDHINQNIFFSLIDGLILVSPSLSVLHSNLAIEDMFHKSRDAIANQPLEELFPSQPQILDKVQKVLTTGACYHDVEAKGKRKTASVYEVRNRCRTNVSPDCATSNHKTCFVSL